MNWRPLKVVGDLTGVALGLYCAYRLVHAFAFGEFYDRTIIAGLAMLTIAAYPLWGRKTSN